MKNLKNNLIGVCYLICFSLCLTLNTLVVKAEENKNIVDFSKKGTISINLSEDLENTKVQGAEITIYKVANAIDKDNNLSFVYDENLNDCKSEIEEGNITNEVLQCIIDSKVSNYNGVTDEDGSVSFTDLDLGLYIVAQTNQVEGYSKIENFSVILPKIIDNMWNYDIVATPKVDIIRLFDLSVEKVWNVSGNNKISSKVTIELLKGTEIIDTVILNKENNWTYTWKQIEKSDKYSVREIEVPAGFTVSYRSEGNKFIVTNTNSLVQTGQKRWVISLLAGIGILFIGLGLVFEKRKTYE